MKELNAGKCFFFGFVLCSLFFQSALILASDFEECPSFGPLVTKESRRVVVFSESGLISALDVQDRYKGVYHLQFITMEPGSLFLPVLLHADMVFYVLTGKGTVTWVKDDGTDDSLDVVKGDIYKLEQGTVFYIHSHPDPTRQRLRIHAIFDTQEAFVGAYSNVSDLVRGFDDKVLQMGFRVSEEAIQTIKWVEKPPSIVPFAAKNESDVVVSTNWEERLLKAIIGSQKPLGMIYSNKKKKKNRAFNLLTTKHDVENCNGWSIAVTRKDFRALRGCDIGVFMVNLTKGSMMGPHWNPRGTEIAIAIHGQGMVQVVCPSVMAGDDEPNKCENARFKVKEGDVFIVPRFHPMAQISFNNDSFVFVGFSTNVKRNYPQFLAGKWSVLKSIRKEILAMSFNVGNETVEELVGSQDDGVMLECASCAEEAEKKMEEEMERKIQEEEAKKREEEEAAKRREEEEAKKRQEEEEAKRREEEEEAKRRQEEEEEEAKRRQEEEEEAKRRQEEEEEEAKRRQEEEEEAKRREEEEEEAKRRQEEEEEAKRRQEEEEAKRREEEEEEAKRRQEEEEAKRRQEEEEAKRRQEEEEEEEAKRRQEEEEEQEETRRTEEEEAAKRREKEKEKEEEMEIEKKEGEEKKLLWKKMWRV